MKNTVNNVSVDILINGKSVQQFTKDNKYFIIGYENNEYEIIIKNDNSFRILASIGCDQINVINGKQNTKDSPGYVIDKYSKLNLKGFRLNDDEVAAFKFTKSENSYSSEKLGKSAQNGIISVNIYKEYQKPEPIVVKEYIPYNPWPSRPWWDRYPWYDYGTLVNPTRPYVTWGGNTSSTFSDPPGNCGGLSSSIQYSCSNNLSTEVKCCNLSDNSSLQDSAPSNHFELGSTFGSVKSSKIIDVEFIKGDYLGEIEIYYSTREKLEEMGVKLKTESKVVFPQGVKKEYCSVPKNWKR